MVSATTTIEVDFGSRVMTGGFLLNNELTDFSFQPETNGAPVANRVEGGKRPRSSMAPTVVLRGGAPVRLAARPQHHLLHRSLDHRDPRLVLPHREGDELVLAA